MMSYEWAGWRFGQKLPKTRFTCRSARCASDRKHRLAKDNRRAFWAIFAQNALAKQTKKPPFNKEERFGYVVLAVKPF
jgi:hypothetical protein